ncbi:43097_t:CDS:2 [Gigaspora margarita]|uniref:43097_t:CDS:1 n=1 Tax=Gigaspora margarita TaxID=4874 RepID=A0ABN7VTJ6_GIGMA|nr:43097_t:CDS:2 [Gigaspora margarita]
MPSPLQTSINESIMPKNARVQNNAIEKIKEVTQQILEHTFAMHRHHHSAKIELASVARTDMKPYIDEYYYLASVKAARVFAKVFAKDSIIIFQDDKAKVGLGVPAVGTSLVTHIADLLSLVYDQQFASVLLKYNKVKPIWVLLIDDGPDKNSRHFKNIVEYCNLFHVLDLDYLTVCTHAPGQSAYNPVEHGMASLSKKLASITLPVDKYGSHLDTQENVKNEELARHNFEFSGQKLYDIWSKDNMHSKPVTTKYIDQIDQLFLDVEPTRWEWSCSAMLLLNKCKKISLPITKGRNNHFIDPIYALQYFDKLKILPYDRYCLSILTKMHQRLSCDVCGKYYPTLKFIAKHKCWQHCVKRGQPQKSQTQASTYN